MAVCYVSFHQWGASLHTTSWIERTCNGNFQALIRGVQRTKGQANEKSQKRLREVPTTDPPPLPPPRTNIPTVREYHTKVHRKRFRDRARPLGTIWHIGRFVVKHPRFGFHRVAREHNTKATLRETGCALPLLVRDQRTCYGNLRPRQAATSHVRRLPFTSLVKFSHTLFDTKTSKTNKKTTKNFPRSSFLALRTKTQTQHKQNGKHTNYTIQTTEWNQRRRRGQNTTAIRLCA